MTTAWAVACIETGREHRVAEQILQEGAEIFWPMCKFKIKRRGPGRNVEKEITEPVWPGYMLIREGTVRNAEALRFVEGFYYFLFYPSGRLKLVPEAIVASLRAMEKSGALTPKDIEMLISGAPIGSQVRVIGGELLQGWKGKVTGLRGEYVQIHGGDFEKPMWLHRDIVEIVK
jgi:hypothetical protein